MLGLVHGWVGFWQKLQVFWWNDDLPHFLTQFYQLIVTCNTCRQCLVRIFGNTDKVVYRLCFRLDWQQFIQIFFQMQHCRPHLLRPLCSPPTHLKFSIETANPFLTSELLSPKAKEKCVARIKRMKPMRPVDTKVKQEAAVLGPISALNFQFFL